jgi:hypothetical protein
MLRIKPTIVKKFALVLVAAFALIAMGTAPAFAATPNPNPTPKPVCDSKHPNCGRDPATVSRADCEKVFGKQSPAYQDCISKNNLFDKYLNPFIAFLSILVGLAVVIGLIVGGIQYIISGGDPQAAANGKRHIRNAIIAFVVYLFLYAIINFLVPGGLFG